jgi:hypothetical protein
MPGIAGIFSKELPGWNFGLFKRCWNVLFMKNSIHQVCIPAKS